MDGNPATRTVRRGPKACIQCGGPMRAVQPIGRIPICCSDACRKAAYGGPAVTQARYLHGQGRRNEHDHRDQAPIETCVNNVLASPWEVRKLLIELARKINRDEFTTTDWIAWSTAWTASAKDSPVEPNAPAAAPDTAESRLLFRSRRYGHRECKRCDAGLSRLFAGVPDRGETKRPAAPISGRRRASWRHVGVLI